jgi:hypothetical protein
MVVGGKSETPSPEKNLEKGKKTSKKAKIRCFGVDGSIE